MPREDRPYFYPKKQSYQHSHEFVTKEDLWCEIQRLRRQIEQLKGQIEQRDKINRDMREAVLSGIEASSDCRDALGEDGHYEAAARSQQRVSTLQFLLRMYEEMDPKYGSMATPYQ